MAQERDGVGRKKLLLVCSSGGHLLQLFSLKNALWNEYDRVWVTFEKSDAQSLLVGEDVYWGYYPTNRNIFNLIRNLRLARRVLAKEGPDCVISTGAGIGVPFLLLARWYGAKSIYIESFARKHNISLTGKLVYKRVDNFFVQSESLTEQYKKAVYRGTIY